jgi:ribosomal protein S18 acetylase RimI-like enzyme
MIAIDRARIEDIAAIKSVLAATWRDTYSSFLPEACIAHAAAQWHSPKVLEAELGRASTFAGVARDAAAGVVGMVTAHSHDDLLVIARLYVLPEFQRQGIGEKLIEASCRAFPQSRRVRLHVEEQNPKGRAFYRKLGFRQIGVQVDDVAGTKLTSIAMEKELGVA